jgi:transposase
MKFVATKSADQLDLQALHRVRERLVGQRTGIINQIRAFLLERSIAVRQGLHFLRAELPGILAKRTDVLSPRMLRVIEDLARDWRRLDERIDALSDEIMTLARQDPGRPRRACRAGLRWRTARNAAPQNGFEPLTGRLTAACSTTELPGNNDIWNRQELRPGREGPPAKAD